MISWSRDLCVTISLSFVLMGTTLHAEPENASLRVVCSPCQQIDGGYESQCEFEVRGRDGERFIGPNRIGINTRSLEDYRNLLCEGARDWAMEFNRTQFFVPDLEEQESLYINVDLGRDCIFQTEGLWGPFSIDRGEDHLFLSTDFDEYHSPTGRKTFSARRPRCIGADFDRLVCAEESGVILKYYCAQTSFIISAINGWELRRLR